MVYVIACGDEGVQLNEGRRLAFAGSGFRLEGFSNAVELLKGLFGADLRLVSSEENDWVKEKLDLKNWEQVNASAQQHTEALADKEKLLYAGYLPFTDPTQIEHGVKGHMVRPHNIHIANKIMFTLGGGEQTYNLGHYVISADWVHLADEALVKQVLEPQIAHYCGLAKRDKLEMVFETEGELGEEVAEKNKVVLNKLGFI
jgi:hypothetical protein